MAKITGADRVSQRLNGMAGREAVELVGKALFAGGEMIRAEAVRLITEGSVSGKNHVPSLPGEPPNADTGQLHSSIHVEQPRPLHVQVIEDAPHAVPLEVGTVNMAERPHMGPASRNKRKEVVALVHRSVNVATRKRK